MSDFLQEFFTYRNYWSSPSPIALLAGASLVLLPLLKWKPLGGTFLGLMERRGLWIGSVLAGIGLLSYVGMVWWYIWVDAFSDHTESSVASISWIVWANADPPYLPIDAAQRYSLLYGPMIYLINGFFLQLLGPSLQAVKVPGAAAALGGLFCLFLAIRKTVSTRMAWWSVGFTAFLFQIFSSASFFSRGNPLLICCVALGLWGTVSTRRLSAILLLALALGISVSLKFHTLLYFLPIFVLFYQRFGLPAFLGTLPISGLIVAAPFLLPHISLANFVALIQTLTQELHWGIVKVSLNYAFFLTVPVLSLCWRGPGAMAPLRRHRLFLLALLLGLAPNLVTGPTHLIPLIPLVVYLTAVLLKQRQETAAPNAAQKPPPLLFTALLMGMIFSISVQGWVRQTQLIRRLETTAQLGVSADLRRFIEDHPELPIAMGFGGNFGFSFYRPLLIFSGSPYLLDATAVMDHQYAGLPIPPKTLEMLRSCRVPVWLTPKGGPPFVMSNPNYRPAHHPLFDEAFQKTFGDHYELKGQTRYFLVWVCKKLS